MDSIRVLTEECAGDQAWDVFVSAVQREGTAAFDVEPLSRDLGDVKIATVLALTLGGHAGAWLHAPCKALENTRPIDVFRADKTGPQIIKALLMRMPR